MEKIQVKVVGKRYITKVNKHTKGYHIHSVIFFSYQDAKVEGLAVASRWVASYCYPPGAILIGSEYELYEENNRVVRLQPVEEKEMEVQSQYVY